METNPSVNNHVGKILEIPFPENTQTAVETTNQTHQTFSEAEREAFEKLYDTNDEISKERKMRGYFD